MVKQKQNMIKKLREDRGFTQQEFAKILATSQTNVSRLESGAITANTDVLKNLLIKFKFDVVKYLKTEV